MAVDNESKTLKTKAEVAGVEGNALEPFLTLARHELAGDNPERGNNLHEHGRSGRLSEMSCRVRVLQLGNDVLVRSHVTTVGAKGLGEGTHKDVNLGCVNAEEVANATAPGTSGADTVGLVNEQVKLVLLLQSKDAGQVAHGALHGVETFNSNEDLPPWTMSPRLALGDGIPELPLQIAHIVVLERLDDSTRDTGTDTDGGVVELVRKDQAALGDESRERAGIGHETHGEYHSSWFADELGHFVLNSNSKIARSSISPRTARTETVLANAFFHSIGAGTLGLGETEVVVGAHIQGFGIGAGELVRAVEILRLAVHEGDVTSGNPGSRSGETVVNAHLQTAHVEVVKIIVERSISVLSLQAGIVPLVAEALAKEVAGMTEGDHQQIADVGGQDVVVRRLVDNGRLELLSVMLANVSMLLAQQRAKLGVHALLSSGLSFCWGLEEGRGRLIEVGFAGGQRDTGKRHG